jgi:hypothetical protein
MVGWWFTLGGGGVSSYSVNDDNNKKGIIDSGGYVTVSWVDLSSLGRKSLSSQNHSGFMM